MDWEENGANAYNNAVFILNDICEKQYSNKELGATARSINLGDIESQIKQEKLSEIKNSYDNGIASYGDVQTCTGSRSYYPNIYAQENESGVGLDVSGKTDEEIKALTKKDGIGISERWYSEFTEEESTRAGNLTVTQTYYELENIPKEDMINEDVYDVLCNGSYWIASRYVDCTDETYAEFGIYLGNQNTFQRFLNMCNSYNGGSIGNIFTQSFRPIVTLSKDIKINPCTGTNGYDNMHTISK